MSRNEAREVIHLTNQPIEEGQSVKAAIDWDRRFDHMQQHTGKWTLFQYTSHSSNALRETYLAR